MSLLIFNPLVHFLLGVMEGLAANVFRGSFERVLCNFRCLNRKTSYRYQVSDHHPLLVSFVYDSTPHRYPSFKVFFKMWFERPKCKSVIHNSWTTTVIGCVMLVLQKKQKKLQRLKYVLKDWNKSIFGNIHIVVAKKQMLFKSRLLQQASNNMIFLSEEK